MVLLTHFTKSLNSWMMSQPMSKLMVKPRQRRTRNTCTGAAVSQSYFLLQIQVQSSTDIKNFKNNEVVVAIQKLAKEHKSVKLAQLASKITTVPTYGGDDVFAKGKAMIEQDIAEIEKAITKRWAKQKAFQVSRRRSLS